MAALLGGLRAAECVEVGPGDRVGWARGAQPQDRGVPGSQVMAKKARAPPKGAHYPDHMGTTAGLPATLADPSLHPFFQVFTPQRSSPQTCPTLLPISTSKAYLCDVRYSFTSLSQFLNWKNGG